MEFYLNFGYKLVKGYFLHKNPGTSMTIYLYGELDGYCKEDVTFESLASYPETNLLIAIFSQVDEAGIKRYWHLEYNENATGMIYDKWTINSVVKMKLKPFARVPNDIVFS